MLKLYAGSGSQEIQLLQPSLPPLVWSHTRDKVARLLTQRGQLRAAELLLNLPFELWDGTNGFNDEFVLLYATLSMQKYLEVADLESDPNQRVLFRQIEAALGETDIHVRFIAAALGEGTEPMSSEPLRRAGQLAASTASTPRFILISATSRARWVSAYRTRACRSCSRPFARATQRSKQQVPVLRTSLASLMQWPPSSTR